MKNIPLFRKVILSLVMLMMSLTFISSLNVYADDEKFETTISFDIHKDKSTSSNNNSPKSYDKNDKNHDGVVTCDEVNGKGWIWSNKKKTCVYSVSNTDSSLITIPSNIGFSFNSDGTVSETIAYTIKNNSTDKPLYIKAITLTGENGWSLVNTKPTSDNSKQVHLTINNIEQVEGKYNFNDYIYLGVGEEVSLTFKIERSSFTSSYKEEAFILGVESYEQGNRIYLNDVDKGSLDTTGTNVKYDDTADKYYIDYPITKSDSTSVTYGTLPTPTNKTGYTFSKWVDQNGTEITSSTTVDSNKTIKASWTANTYSIAFDSNGGTGTMSNQEMTYDTEAALTTNSYTRADYTFAGWNTKVDGTGTSYANNALVNNLTSENNGTFTLYAMWKPSPSTSNITISINNGDFTSDNPTKEYDGQGINTFTVKFKDTTLTQGTDYTVTYKKDSNNVEASSVKSPGTYTITINFIGDYGTSSIEKTYTISAKALTVSGFKVDDKAMDGTTIATITTSNNYSLEGVVNGENVTLNSSSITATFDSATVGQNKTVTASGFSLEGNDKDNYTLTQPTTTANITFSLEGWRKTWSGKSLGSEITTEQLAEIASGSLSTIGLGDYWTIITKVDGNDKDVNYRVADYKYYYEYYNQTSTYDLCIVPDSKIGTRNMNDNFNYTSQWGYWNSSLHNNIINYIPDSIKSHLYEHTISASTAINISSPYANTWEDKTSKGAELMSVAQVYPEKFITLDASITGSSEISSSNGLSSPANDKQLAMFKFNMNGDKLDVNKGDYKGNKANNIVKNEYGWWLSSTYQSDSFAYVPAFNYLGGYSLHHTQAKNENTNGIRPLIVIKGTSN